MTTNAVLLLLKDNVLELTEGLALWRIEPTQQLYYTLQVRMCPAYS